MDWRDGEVEDVHGVAEAGARGEGYPFIVLGENAAEPCMREIDIRRKVAGALEGVGRVLLHYDRR